MSFESLNIEQIESSIGIIVSVLCTACVLAKRRWPTADIRLFARGFFGIGLLADSYWGIYAAIYGVTPSHFYVAELGWLAQELFLALLVVETYRMEGTSKIHPAAWAAPAVIAVLTVWFITTSGQVVISILMGGALGFVALVSLSALLTAKQDRVRGIERHCGLYAAVFAFVVLEHLLWSASILVEDWSVMNAYYWINLVLYGSLIAILVATVRIGNPSKEADA